MDNRHIVMFSSGITEQSGTLPAIKDALEALGYECADWRAVFKTAHDNTSIALLPMLIKKIPTFDYAVLICEGHDRVEMVRDGHTEFHNVMRDNVLFEVGLCTMALGYPRTILICDDDVRMPEDLIGPNDQLLLHRVAETLRYQPGTSTIANATSLARAIHEYITTTGQDLSPATVGGASYIASGYLANFVLGIFQNIDDGYRTAAESDARDSEDAECAPADVHPASAEHTYIHMVLPERYTKSYEDQARAVLAELPEGSVQNGNRSLTFHYRQVGDDLHIVDYPTTLGSSYDTAKRILSIEADDAYDPSAEQRYMDKELNLFDVTFGFLSHDEAFLRQTLAGRTKGDLPMAAFEQLVRTYRELLATHLDVRKQEF